jgi:hypothetical protein
MSKKKLKMKSKLKQFKKKSNKKLKKKKLKPKKINKLLKLKRRMTEIIFISLKV